jgi:hypothetical protein
MVGLWRIPRAARAMLDRPIILGLCGDNKKKMSWRRYGLWSLAGFQVKKKPPFWAASFVLAGRTPSAQATITVGAPKRALN